MQRIIHKFNTIPYFVYVIWCSEDNGKTWSPINSDTRLASSGQMYLDLNQVREEKERLEKSTKFQFQIIEYKSW